MASRHSNGGHAGAAGRRRFETTEPEGQQQCTREGTEDCRSAARVARRKMHSGGTKILR